MSYWHLLELQPTKDKLSIKKAYAKKLKRTKPDEDPDGFKALHHAYKKALSWADVEDGKDYENIDQTDRNNTTGAEGDPNEGEEKIEVKDPVAGFDPFMATKRRPRLDDDAEATGGQHDGYERHESLFQDLEKKTEAILGDDKDRNDLKVWRGHLQTEALFDPELNEHIGYFLFGLIYQLDALKIEAHSGEDQQGLASQFSLHPEIMIELEEYFNWRLYREDLENDFGEVFVECFFAVIAEDGRFPENVEIRVRGAKVLGGVDDQKFVHSKEALNSISRMLTGLTIVIAVAFAILVAMTVLGNADGMSLWGLFGAGLVMALLSWFVHSGNRIALHVTWVLAFFLIFTFPVGTILAVILFWKLPKAYYCCRYL